MDAAVLQVIFGSLLLIRANARHAYDSLRMKSKWFPCEFSYLIKYDFRVLVSSLEDTSSR